VGRNGSVKPIGCHEKFRHIVKQDVIGSARIAGLCSFTRNRAIKNKYNVLAGTREQFTTQQKCHACLHAGKEFESLLLLKANVCYLNRILGWERFLSTILSVLIHCSAKETRLLGNDVLNTDTFV